MAKLNGPEFYSFKTNFIYNFTSCMYVCMYVCTCKCKCPFLVAVNTEADSSKNSDTFCTRHKYSCQDTAVTLSDDSTADISSVLRLSPCDLWQTKLHLDWTGYKYSGYLACFQEDKLATSEGKHIHGSGIGIMKAWSNVSTSPIPQGLLLNKSEIKVCCVMKDVEMWL